MPKKRNENIIEQNIPADEFKAIDFFCGGGGMTCGLRQAGIHVLAGVDFDKNAQATYEYNNPGSTFIHKDIRRLHSDYFERNFGIQRNDDRLILVGCSPCQYYSIINTDRTKSELSKTLLLNFARFVEYYKPGYVLVENVPGIVTNKESVLPQFLKKLAKLDYKVTKGIVDMSLNHDISLPAKDDHLLTVADVLGERNGFPKIAAGHKDSTPFAHTTAGLSDICLQRLAATPHNGGDRMSWKDNPNLQLPCYVGKDENFRDTYGRIWWNRPSPTITTKFFSISNGRFAHPDENRALSIREGATLQTFPKDYEFKTNSIAAAARIIGNAVPCEYAKRLGETIKQY